MQSLRLGAICVLFVVPACSGSDHEGGQITATGGVSAATSGGAPAAGASAGGATSVGAQTGGSPGMGAAPSTAGGAQGKGGSVPVTGAGGAPSGGAAGSGAGGVPASAGNGGTAGAGAGGKANPPGPEDGDPAKPVVAIPNVPCRNPSAPGFGLGQPNLKVDDRDVIVDYPCNKHEGAPVTVILNLHGTTPDAQRFYQWGYFSAYKYVASHNLVVLTPKSVVDQWGNGDNGADEPYLLDTIDWAYKNFAVFDIRGMWVGGHSWGSFYASRFGCNDKIADKVKGIILMSGASRPACAARVSIINSAANLKPDPNDSTKTIVAPEALLDQNAIAMMHGCDAQQMMAVDANNDETFWPNCDPGFAHANYLMKTKQHATFMDASVVKSIVDWIKLVRQ